MTLSNTNRTVVAIGNGATTVWPFSFRIPSGMQEVLLYDVASGVTTTLVESDYTITGLDNDAGGSVTYPLSGSPLTSATKIVINRTAPYIQELDVDSQNAYDPALLEGELDKIVMQTQQLAEEVDRSVKVSQGAGTDPADLINSLLDAAADAEAAATAAAASAAAADVSETNAEAIALTIDLVVVPTRAALAALDHVAHTHALFNGSKWNWVSSNLSTYVALDTQQGIFVAPNSDTSGASGAWRRECVNDDVSGGEWMADWFQPPTDNVGDCTSAFTAMLNLGNTLKPSKITFGSLIYCLISGHLPQIKWQVHIAGVRGNQGTILLKQYIEADTVRGVLSFTDFGFHLSDFNVRATSGSGGSGISAVLTLNSPAAGRTYLERMVVSGGDFFNYSLYINGQTNVTVDGPSYRGVWIDGGEYFGAAAATMAFVGAHHVFATGVFGATSGGSSDIVLQLSGTAAAYNDDFQWHGLLSGKVNLNWLSRSTFVSPMTNNIAIDSNSTDITWDGPKNFGGISNSAAAGEFTFLQDGVVVASGGDNNTGWRKWGSGKIEQWGRGTTSAGILAVTWPVAFGGISNCSVNCTQNSGGTSITVGQAADITITGFNCKTMGMSTTPSVSLASAAFTYHAIGA